MNIIAPLVNHNPARFEGKNNPRGTIVQVGHLRATETVVDSFQAGESFFQIPKPDAGTTYEKNCFRRKGLLPLSLDSGNFCFKRVRLKDFSSGACQKLSASQHQRQPAFFWWIHSDLSPAVPEAGHSAC